MAEKVLIVRRPDDMHLHLRDDRILEGVLPFTSQNFGRAIIMPNLVPPITSCEMAFSYRERILKALPEGQKFEPLMTLYLTETSEIEDIRNGVKSGLVHALKLYPAGATTNSFQGVRNFENIYPILEVLVESNVPLLVHGEIVDNEVDIFDRERVFIEKILDPLIEKFPLLRVVLEHVTTLDGVNFIKQSKSNVFGTITAHHLALNRNDLFRGGINPHNYCLPVLKREEHRMALLSAAVSGDRKFFLGTDSAPHFKEAKESSCGCAGIFSAINALSVVTTLFENEGSLSNLEKFISLNGCEFYGLQPNKNCLSLTKKSKPIKFPQYIKIGSSTVKVFDPGFDLYWFAEPLIEK